MNSAASHLATRRAVRGVVQTAGFRGNKGVVTEPLAKEKKGLFLDQGIFFEGIIMQINSTPTVGWGGPYWCWTEKFQTG